MSVHLSSNYGTENVKELKCFNLSEMCPLDKISSVTAEMNSRYINSSSLFLDKTQ